MSSRLEALADRLELQQLVTDYANAIDARQWDRLDRIFTPDAFIDYRAMGGAHGPYPEIKRWLADALAKFPAYLHHVGNFHFEIAGDKATGSVACFNPMAVPNAAGGSDVMFLGLYYDDEYVRTSDGWRIARRSERKSYMHNMPEWMKKALRQMGAAIS